MADQEEGLQAKMERWNELALTLQTSARTLKEELSMPEPAHASSASATAASSYSAKAPGAPQTEGALSRRQRIGLQGLVADSLDNLISVYVRIMMTGSAEDRLMKTDMENVRGYLRRVAQGSRSQASQMEVCRSTARRFVTHGLSLPRSTSNEADMHDDESRAASSSLVAQADRPATTAAAKRTKLNQAQLDQKIESLRAQHRRLPPVVLPEIKQVSKEPLRQEEGSESESESDSDTDLKIYDD